MHAITVLSMLRILSQMSFYQANDFAEATFAENMKLKVQVISSNNQGSARVKFTTDDKVMALEIGDSVQYGAGNGVIRGVHANLTYDMSSSLDEDGDPIVKIQREDLTLIERTVQVSTLAMGDIFLQKLMDPDARVSLSLCANGAV